MPWPAWIDELKDRYLADEANVFVLHGAVASTTFAVEEELLDCVGVLQRFLARTRPIIGVLRPWPLPSRIEFAGIMDRTRFENLIKAHDFVEGRVDALQETDPAEALARIWRALDTTGTDQAYLVTDAHRIAPGHRKRVDPIPGAPGFLEWPTHPMLRASNNLIVLLVEDPDQLRSELLEGSALVEATEPEPPSSPDLTSTPSPLPEFTELDDQPEPTLVPDNVLPEELDDELSEAPEPTLVPEDDDRQDDDSVEDGDPIEPEDLVPELTSTLARTLTDYGAAGRAALLPVMDATAQVIAAHRPGTFGGLTFGLDDDGRPAASDPGGSDFLAMWRRDITLDAAASMIIRELPDELPDAPEPDATGVRVLAKRVAKAIAKL